MMGTPKSWPLLSPPWPHHPLSHGQATWLWEGGETVDWRGSPAKDHLVVSETLPSAPSALSILAPRQASALDTTCSLPGPLGRKR